MRLTKKQREDIRKRFEDGESAISLAEIFNTTVPTIYYWASNDKKKNKIIYQINRFRKLPLSERRKTYQKRKEYIKSYKRKRYASDEEYRKHELSRQKKLRDKYSQKDNFTKKKKRSSS